MNKIVILTDRHICDNPRVWKEANLLANNGYKVIILTSWINEEKLERDKALLNSSVVYLPFLNMLPNHVGGIQRLILRSRGKLAILLKRWFNIETRWLIGYAPDLLYHYARKETTSLYIAHVETGLYAGIRLLKEGKKVAFDFEDWYSEDYLVRERPVRLLKKLEKLALQYGVYCTCPSEAMATALILENGTKKKVAAIYNGFGIKENYITDSGTGGELPVIVWFSQTIGPGRGLENFLKALNYLQNKVELLLIGNCSIEYYSFLEKSFPFDRGHSLKIEPPVGHHDLVKRISTCSVGLALEQKVPLSRDKTITNKILQYLQAGLKVLATETSGQLEVAKYLPGLISVVPTDNPKNWASELDSLLESNNYDKQSILSVFNNVFSLDAQEKKIIELVKTVIKE